MANKIKSQVERKEKIKKCLLQRHNARDISIRNARYEAPDQSFSHSMGRQLVESISLLSYSQKKMLSRLLAKIIYNNGITVARNYFVKMIGMGVKTVSNYIKLFESVDLIRVDQYFEAPNDFRLGPAALNEVIRNYLLPHLPVLRLLIRLPIMLLASQVHASEFPLLYKKDINNTARLKYKTGKIEQRLAHELQVNAPMYRYIYHRFVKKDRAMNIDPVTEQLESLKLTTTGMIKLSAFPTEAIRFADSKLKSALFKKSVADPFGYLCRVASIWCKDRSAPIKYQAVHELMRNHNCNEDDKRIVAILISEKDTPTKPTMSQEFSRKKQEAERETYYCEQEAWAQMTLQERKDHLKPMVYQLCDANIESWALRYCPYKDAQPIIETLISEYKQPKKDQQEAWNSLSPQQQADIWLPLLPTLKNLSKEQRAHYLRNSGCEYAILKIEDLIASSSSQGDQPCRPLSIESKANQ